MYFRFNLTICQVFLVFTFVKCLNSYEYFSSIAGLESLLKTEEILIKDFRKYIEESKANIETFERELHKIEAQHKIAFSNTEDYLTNPINVYLLIKRLYSDWYSYQERIRNDNVAQNLLSRMEVHKSILDFPSDYDIYGAALALMRLQSTYKLKVEDIAAGTLNDVQYGTKMNWHDCYELGRQLHGAQEYNFTKLWMMTSIKLLTDEDFAKEPFALDFMETVAETMLGLRDIQTAYNLSSKVLKIDANRVKAWDITFKTKNMLSGSEEITMLPQVTHWQNTYHLTNEFSTYEQLCRAEIKQFPSQERNLRCRYITNKKPYRIFMPFKIEEHNLDPLIITIHDVLSNEKVEVIKNLAIPKLQTSTVRAADPISEVRVSKNAWLEYQSHPYMQYMLRELHDATKLDVSLCEQLQVANYGLGGHYEPHWDFFLPEEMSLVPEGQGNRMATAIFYLSDVAQGGATVFPNFRLAVWPKKGSVLFWYNLHASVDRDFRTRHAGCPVIKGSKWIANVWINDVTQTFARPCNKQRDHEKSLGFEDIK